VCAYVATLLVLSLVRFPAPQWAGLLSVVCGTAAAVAVFEHRRWPLGLCVRPARALPQAFAGVVLGGLLVAAAAVAIVLTTATRHARGAGIPWLELLVVYVPAVLHEELLFRGYAFQKLYSWNRSVALIGIAVVFALLHGNNSAVTLLGLTNVFLGGVLLGLAREAGGTLWAPLGLHLAWNVMSGPVLGHEVSGYVPAVSLYVARGEGPAWLTGGEFGIEGSIWMTVTTVCAIGLLGLRHRRSTMIG
jgi:membrane protease YdiL (CAAX protease family)